MLGRFSIRSRTVLALTAVSLVALLVLGSWLFARDGMLSRETGDLGELARMAAPMPWARPYRAPEATVNGVTLAGRRFWVSDTGMAVEFWLLVRDPSLQDSQVNPVGVSLHSKEKEYTLRGAGTLLAGGGIHFAEGTFSGYDYASSHPYVPGRNKELTLSIKALEVLDSKGEVVQVVQGPWESVVAVRNDLPGRPGASVSTVIGEFSQSQFGVTVQLRPEAGVGWVQPYEVVREGKETKFKPLGLGTNGPRLISQEEYQQALKDTAEVAAKGPYYDWIPVTPVPDSGAPSGPVGLGSQTGNATVQVGSVSIPQGQQAQVAVTVKGVNDPDGLGGYDFKITFNLAVVNVVSVSGGQAPFSGTPTYKAYNAAGQVFFNATQGSIPGPTGDIVVAYVTLQAVGSPGSSTSLDISIFNLLETAAGDNIPAVDSDGTVTIQ